MKTCAKTAKHKIPLLCALCFCSVIALIGARRVFAADSSGPQISVSGGSKQYIPYDPPHERQVHFEITFLDGAPNGDGHDLMKGVKIKEFAVTGGEPQMVAEAPECLVDPKLTEFNSAGPLQVHAQNGKFFVSGKGFFFRRGDSSLVISNDAHSVIQTQTTNGMAQAPTEIFSQRARFQMKNEATNGTATYEMNVRVIDPKMKLTSEYLFAELPKASAGQSNRLDHIVAETNVVIDFINESGEKTHATGDKAVYDYKTADGATNEVLQLTGNPRVELTNGWMTADLLVVDRGAGHLQGQDNVHFHFVAQNQNANASATTNAPPETDIYSDRFDYDMNTRLAQFGSVWSHVRVRDPRIRLDCKTLTAALPPSGAVTNNRIDHIVAEDDVSLDFPDEKNGRNIHANGQKAVYDYKVAGGVTNQLLELTGNPTVEMANPAGWMTADVIRVDRAQGMIWGVGNQHSVWKKQTNEPVAMDTEIFSHRFQFTQATGLAVYDENVRAYDPEMNLTSKQLTIKLAKVGPGQTNRLESVTADGDVSVDFVQKAFVPSDITNAAALVARLTKPPEDDAPAQFVAAQLTPATREILTSDAGGKAPALREALAGELNRLTESGWIYETNRFAKVKLSSDTSALLGQHPMGIDLVELNRLLLLDAFRGELARTERGEKTHATGQRAIYAYEPAGNTNDAVLRLVGEPRLDKPDGWVTAEQEIIFDRTTGVSHFVGKPHFHMKFGGFTGIQTPGAEPKQEKKKK